MKALPRDYKVTKCSATYVLNRLNGEKCLWPVNGNAIESIFYRPPQDRFIQLRLPNHRHTRVKEKDERKGQDPRVLVSSLANMLPETVVRDWFGQTYLDFEFYEPQFLYKDKGNLFFATEPVPLKLRIVRQHIGTD